MVVRQRGSAATRPSTAAVQCLAKRAAVAAPISAASRVLMRPATGSFAITTKRQGKGAARGRGARRPILARRGPSVIDRARRDQAFTGVNA
jgi:hypothetical protein